MSDEASICLGAEASISQPQLTLLPNVTLTNIFRRLHAPVCNTSRNPQIWHQLESVDATSQTEQCPTETPAPPFLKKPCTFDTSSNIFRCICITGYTLPTLREVVFWPVGPFWNNPKRQASSRPVCSHSETCCGRACLWLLMLPSLHRTTVPVCPSYGGKHLACKPTSHGEGTCEYKERLVLTEGADVHLAFLLALLSCLDAVVSCISTAPHATRQMQSTCV